MDVSIAVTLIRGQMGAVVERAVNGAVETVLAEMLKVVGVKFEELKSQVALMKRDVASLQRDQVLKEKENDNIRAKLRYTELKLKYYRQGVEEELQQRASALVRIHPSPFLQAQRDGAGVSSTEASTSCSTLTRTSSNPECTSSPCTSRHSVRVRGVPDVGVASCDASDFLLPVSLSGNTGTLDSSAVLFCPTKRDPSPSKDEPDACEWSAALPPLAGGADPARPVQTLEPDPGRPAPGGSLSPDVSTQADSSTLPFSAPQVKQEQQEEEEEEEEVICIKEEPEDVQEVMATLLLDCQLQQGQLESEAQRSVTEGFGLPAVQRNHAAAFSSAGPHSCEDLMPQPVASLQSLVALPPGAPPRQAVRPWTKDLSLYEEYKLRRNELRRRSINRRRELEKTLPQPLLADLVRERREKTRLRVARWRAKRKLQDGTNQDHALGGAAGLSQSGFSISTLQHHQHHQQQQQQHQQHQQQQHQQLRLTCAAASSSQQRQSSALAPPTSFLSNNTFIPSSSSSSSLLMRGHSMAPHQHTVTSSSSSSSSSSYVQVSLLQQSISLTDSDILQ